MCVLYECVTIILSINTSKTLKKIGIDLLCLFLENQNKNSIYLSLKLLNTIAV
jgi:hypothetical protein